METLANLKKHLHVMSNTRINDICIEQKIIKEVIDQQNQFESPEKVY